MALIYCTKHTPANNSALAFCFVNKDGSHHSVAECTCAKYSPEARARMVRSYPDLQERYKNLEVATGKKINTIPLADFKEYTKANYGKVDPNCPIEDPHEPIARKA